jgi:hypothetical protein
LEINCLSKKKIRRFNVRPSQYVPRQEGRGDADCGEWTAGGQPHGSSRILVTCSTELNKSQSIMHAPSEERVVIPIGVGGGFPGVLHQRIPVETGSEERGERDGAPGSDFGQRAG